MWPLWQDMLDQLAPYPTSADPNAMGVLQLAGEPVYAIGIGYDKRPGSDADPRMIPEGGFALDWQHEGTFSEGLGQALLQSGATSPGGTPIIRVFPAWPKDMDASFSLRAKGDFIVTSLIKASKVDFIEVTSQRGGPCTLRNYWGKQSVDLYRNNKKSETLLAELLTFATKAGENIVVVKSGTKPADFRLACPESKQ